MTTPSEEPHQAQPRGSAGRRTARARRERPGALPDIDEESRERWEDESPATTVDRPGSGTETTPRT